GVDIHRLHAVVATVGVALVAVDLRIPRRRSAVVALDLNREVVHRQRVVLVGAVVVVARDRGVTDGANRLRVTDRAVLPQPLTGGEVEENDLVRREAGWGVATNSDQDLGGAVGCQRQRKGVFAVVLPVLSRGSAVRPQVRVER